MQKRLLIASESSCLAEKRELPEEKNNDNIETCIEHKINYKFVRNKETEIVGNNIKTPYVENLHKKNQQNQFQRNFHNKRNDNNAENQLVVKYTNIETNSNEDNRLRINGSNTQNVKNESTGESNQGKLAFILGDNIEKDVDGYLLTGFINEKQ